jgi:hypothetical protein
VVKAFVVFWSKMYVCGKEKIMCYLCFFNEEQQRKKSPFNGFLKEDVNVHGKIKGVEFHGLMHV